jgi:hypothetical protein
MIGFRPIGGYLSGLTNLNSAQIEAYVSLTVAAATHVLFSMKAYGDWHQSGQCFKIGIG